MIKAVIFDCFGVFTEDGWLAFMGKYSNDDNFEELQYANRMADRGNIPYEELLDTLCRLTKASRDEAHSIITTTHHPNIPLFEYAKKLKSAGYDLGMISNVGSPLTDFLPREYVELFDVVTLSYQVGVIKPDPAIYEACLSSLNLSPAQTVFIDDRESNVAGAKAVGMQALQYTSVSTTKTKLTELGVIV